MKNLSMLAALALLLAACGTTPVAMNYQTAGVMPFATSTPAVTVAGFVDSRGEPANWLGAIRGGFGNPLKTLETQEPVAKMVQMAFADGVRARSRGQNGRNPVEVRGTVRKLDCSQYVRREAHAIIEL
jgi:hypothetical protein